MKEWMAPLAGAYDVVVVGAGAIGLTAALAAADAGAEVTAHPMGPGYPGAGATLGPGMTMAYLAGRAVVG